MIGGWLAFDEWYLTAHFQKKLEQTATCTVSLQTTYPQWSNASTCGNTRRGRRATCSSISSRTLSHFHSIRRHSAMYPCESLGCCILYQCCSPFESLLISIDFPSWAHSARIKQCLNTVLLPHDQPRMKPISRLPSHPQFRIAYQVWARDGHRETPAVQNCRLNVPWLSAKSNKS